MTDSESSEILSLGALAREEGWQTTYKELQSRSTMAVKNLNPELPSVDDQYPQEWIDEYNSFMEKFRPLIATSWPRPEQSMLAVQLYVRETEECLRDKNGNPTSFVSSDINKDKFEYVSSVGLVLELGPDAFIGPNFREKSRAPARVGEWVIFPRNAGKQIWYRKKTLFLVRDLDICARVPSPADYHRYG